MKICCSGDVFGSLLTFNLWRDYVTFSDVNHCIGTNVGLRCEVCDACISCLYSALEIK